MKKTTFIFFIIFSLSTQAQKTISIGMDHPYTYTLNSNSLKNDIDCNSHDNFQDGNCRSKANQEIVNYLSKALKLPVEIVNIENRELLKEDFYMGKLDFVMFHVNDFEEAIHTHRNLVEPLLTVTEQFEANHPQTDYYYANFVVKKNSDLKSIKDLRGKKIGFRCYSTSGSDIPFMMLKDNNINPPEDISVVRYPDIKQQVESFIKGEINSIVIWDYYFKHYLHSHNLNTDDFRIIAKYKIPNRVFAANKSRVSKSMQTKFVKAMINMPKDKLIGQSFRGVVPYQSQNYKNVLLLLKKYRKLNNDNKGCENMIMPDKARIWRAKALSEN